MSGSPTLKLHNLTSATNRTLNSLINLPTHKTIEKAKKDLQELRRRSHIMSLLYDRCIIAVAGLQGVGKSTLMSNLYGFDDESSPLLGNQGQGETLPVLITESENPGKLYLHKIVTNEGASSFIREEVHDVKVFREKAHKYSAMEDILLEVTVPFKVFNSSDRSFLLLPGFQKETGYLKELTYTALRTSMNCLILFYANKYAHRDNKELIEALNTEFREASPIFTLTWSDKDEDNIELAKTIKRDLNISEDDRVIRTGNPGPDGWQILLTEAVLKYSVPSSGILEVQQKNMERLIDDYYSVLADIEVSVGQLDIKMQNDEYQQVEKYIKVFRKESEDLKDSMKRKLDEVFPKYFSRIKSKVEEELIERYDGLGGFFKSAGELFKKNILIRKEMKELAESCIKTANINNVPEELLIINNRVANDQWQKHAIIMNLPTEANIKYNKQTLLIGEEKQKQLPIPNEILSDIKAILNPDPKVEFSKDLENSVKFLAVLVLESYRLNSIVAIDTPEGHFPQNAFQDESLFRHYQQNKKEVAIGLGVLFGMDILEGDGIDFFGLIQHNAINGGSALAAASFSWTLGVLAVAGGLVYMLDQMSKSIDRKNNDLNYYLDKLKDHTYETVLSNFDAGMKRFEDILRGCLARKHGLQEGFANVQNCYLSIQSLEENLREIQKLVVNGKWVN